MISLNVLKPLSIAAYAGASLAVMGCVQMASAQEAEPEIIYQPNPDSPIGERNPDGPAELAQYDFLIGDWDVEITWYFPGQEPSVSKAKWHNHWIVNGNVVMLEWRGPQFTGTEIRQWDKRQGKWVGVNIYPDFGPNMPTATSEKVGDEMLVFIPYVGPEGPYINRETYYDIKADSYKMKSDISKDGGETWERGMYEMTVTRTPEQN